MASVEFLDRLFFSASAWSSSSFLARFLFEPELTCWERVGCLYFDGVEASALADVFRPGLDGVLLFSLVPLLELYVDGVSVWGDMEPFASAFAGSSWQCKPGGS